MNKAYTNTFWRAVRLSSRQIIVLTLLHSYIYYTQRDTIPLNTLIFILSFHSIAIGALVYILWKKNNFYIKDGMHLIIHADSKITLSIPTISEIAFYEGWMGKRLHVIYAKENGDLDEVSSSLPVTHPLPVITEFLNDITILNPRIKLDSTCEKWKNANTEEGKKLTEQEKVEEKARVKRYTSNIEKYFFRGLVGFFILVVLIAAVQIVRNNF